MKKLIDQINELNGKLERQCEAIHKSQSSKVLETQEFVKRIKSTWEVKKLLALNSLVSKYDYHVDFVNTSSYEDAIKVLPLRVAESLDGDRALRRAGKMLTKCLESLIAVLNFHFCHDPVIWSEDKTPA